MKKLYLIALVLFTQMYLIGCGGGSSGSAIDAETDSNQTTINVTPTDSIQITINVTPHILKIDYLPSVKTVGTTFSIDATSAEGNVTLLDTATGRYSYLSSPNAQEGQDDFTSTVTYEDGETQLIQVHVQIKQILMTLNDIVDASYSSNLPIVILDTGDKEILDEPKIKGTMTIIETDDTNRSNLTLSPSYSGYMEIEIRGSSSQFYYPKKQYGVDTLTWDNEDDDVSLLGMPKEHKWILQAPYGDKSLMRNYLAYHKTREIDESKYYAVRSHFVELLVREGDHYRYDGVYVLMEKIVRDKNRVNITKLSSEDYDEPEVTGGYIFKQDGIPDLDESSFFGATGTEFIYVDPKASKITDDQMYYIENYVQQFETAIESPDFNNSSHGDYYANWIDDDSFVVHLLSREFFRDADTWLFSEYLHKDRDQKLSMSTVWDFDTGMGNDDFRYDGRIDGWSFDILKDGYAGYALRYWMERLMSDPVFHQKVEDKWLALRSTIWSDDNLALFISQTQNILEESAARNFERWPDVLGVYVWPNREACLVDDVPVYCQTFDSAVNEDLKTWLLNRAHWIDSQF